MKLAPYQCKDMYSADKLNEQGVGIGDRSIELRPNVVVIRTNDCKLNIPQKHFERFARWFLEEQEIEED